MCGTFLGGTCSIPEANGAATGDPRHGQAGELESLCHLQHEALFSCRVPRHSLLVCVHLASKAAIHMACLPGLQPDRLASLKTRRSVLDDVGGRLRHPAGSVGCASCGCGGHAEEGDPAHPGASKGALQDDQVRLCSYNDGSSAPSRDTSCYMLSNLVALQNMLTSRKE